MIRAGLVQLSSSDDPEANLPATLAAIGRAAAEGADWILTPEVTNCVSARRARQEEVLRPEGEDRTLAAIREAAARLGVPVLIGSLALKSEDGDGRFVNRSLAIGADGGIAARYDKIHMFDADPSVGERYRESAGYRPGTRAVLTEAAGLRVGLTICYDLRFGALYRALAQAGAEVLTVPSAFARATGAAHWEVLLRARAIETGCYVLAPAQCGEHAAAEGAPRRTHGRSMAVAPLGRGAAASSATRRRSGSWSSTRRPWARRGGGVPSLAHDRPFEAPA